MPIPRPRVDALYSCLKHLIKISGGVLLSKKSKPLFFIAPFLAYASDMLDDGRLLLDENENMEKRQVQATGHFKFVICRGDKRIVIVEAKKDGMEQGMAQNLFGCELLSDVEQLPVVL